MVWDLIVIGGGAAGFFGAIAHAEQAGGRALILEKTANVLAKVKISGGGALQRDASLFRAPRTRQELSPGREGVARSFASISR
jgi:thioredoxin reductase